MLLIVAESEGPCYNSREFQAKKAPGLRQSKKTACLVYPQRLTQDRRPESTLVVKGKMSFLKLLIA